MTDPKSIRYPLLLTDCSAPGVRAGILGETGWLAYENLEGETGSALFHAVEALLTKTGLSLEDMQSFAYCAGPGSTLGIRINSMALRTWNSLGTSPKPIYAYRSLVAATVLIRSELKESGPFTVLSDLRRRSWNALAVDEHATPGEIQIVEEDVLPAWPEPRFFIQQRIHTPGIPHGATVIRYDLETIGPMAEFLATLTQVDSPKVFQTTTTKFKKWTPTRHR